MADDLGLKRQKLCGEDRISALPEALLCRILSSLTTQQAVGTSFLSTRWRYLWTYVVNLEFSDSFKTTPRKPVRYEFVERVMLLHRAPNIHKLCIRLYSRDHDPWRVSAWISAAIARNLVELDLYASLSNVKVKLPEFLYSSNKLAVLKLESGILLNVPPVVSLPCLKILHLKRIPSCLDDNAIEKIISGTPILEKLTILIDISTNEPKTLCICSSSLKTLQIDAGSCSFRHDIKFELDTPNLQVFDLTDYIWHRTYNVINNLSLLVKVAIAIDRNFYYGNGEEDGEKFLGFLTKILSTVKILQLSGSVFQNETPNGDFPFLPNELSFVPRILKCSINLEVLVIENKKYEDFMWSIPDNVPECMLLRLRTIEFKGFLGFNVEMGMVEYFLRNSMVLEKMIISCGTVDTKRQLDISKKLFLLPRVSLACIISFS